MFLSSATDSRSPVGAIGRIAEDGDHTQTPHIKDYWNQKVLFKSEGLQPPMVEIGDGGFAYAAALDAEG